MVNHSFCLFRGFDSKCGSFPEPKKTIAVGKTTSLWGEWRWKLYESDEKNDKCRNHMVSYGRATRSRVIYHFWPLKGIHLLSISEFINPIWDWSMWMADHISPWKKKAKWNYGLGEFFSWTLIIPYSESTGVDRSYLKLLEGTPRTVKKNPWLFRYMLLKQWEKRYLNVYETHTTKCMRLLPIRYGKRKMTLQWKVVLDLGIFPLNHHWWKSLLVKLDIKMTLTNQLGKKPTKSLPSFLK